MKKWVLRVLVVAGLVVVVGLFFHRGEAQYSPESFQHRGVRLFYLPGPDWVIFSWPDRPYRKRIVAFWIDEGYLATPPTSSAKWDAVGGYQSWRRGNYGGPAKAFWYRSGCNSDEEAQEWIAWSQQHPDLAARLWPKVTELLGGAAKGGKYWVNYQLAAQLMRFVRDCGDLQSFTKAYAKWELWYQGVREEVGIQDP